MIQENPDIQLNYAIYSTGYLIIEEVYYIVSKESSWIINFIGNENSNFTIQGLIIDIPISFLKDFSLFHVKESNGLIHNLHF